MRRASFLSLTAVLFLAPLASAAERPRLELADEGRPIWELRPLDRRVYVLTLDGKWTAPPTPGVKHYVNVIFANGAVASHRVLDEALVRKGEIRCVIQGHELQRNQPPRDGKLTIVISKDREVTSATAPEVISEPFVTAWPLDRPLVTRPPQTRHSKPDELDAFPLPDDPLIKYKPKPKK